MTQYNLKPGLRKFGARGETAAISELTQLRVMDTWTVMDPTKLTREDRRKALSLLLFLKEKQCGKIKGRACVNGAPQRVYIPKEDAALLTVSTESIFVTSAIAASEKRHPPLRQPTNPCCEQSPTNLHLPHVACAWAGSAAGVQCSPSVCARLLPGS